MGSLIVFSFDLAILKGIQMKSIVALAVFLIFGSFVFAAASELENDDLMREDEEYDRAASGHGHKCKYCPKNEPFCHGYCDYEKKECYGHCYKYAHKVSTSDQLSAIASELFKIDYGSTD